MPAPRTCCFAVDPKNLAEGWFRRRVLRPLLEQLRQGATPEGLAASCAVGVVIGVNPILGSTTILCVAAGALGRLNHVALQLANHVVYPLELILMPVFVRLGEWLFRLDPVPLNPVTLVQEFSTGPVVFLRKFGGSGLAGVAVWLALGVPAGFLGAQILKSIFRRLAKRKGQEIHDSQE